MLLLITILFWNAANLDTVELAHRVVELGEIESPQVIVVDATGMGQGTYDTLMRLGFRDSLNK